MERNGAREMEERRCIRDSGKALKKYGSTAKHMTRTDSLVKHTVCPTDTLQGIALKYGVTVSMVCLHNLFSGLCTPYVHLDSVSKLIFDAAYSRLHDHRCQCY